MDFSADESPAVKALGPMFKLTELHLWDDGSSEVRELAYFQEPIKLIDGDDDKDCEKYKNGSFNGFCLIPKDVELAKELNELGLPLSFHTNKKTRHGETSGKRKGSRKKNPQSHSDTGGFMAIKEEYRFPGMLIDSASESLDQSEIPKSCAMEERDGLPNLSLERDDSVSSTAYTSTITNEHDRSGDISSNLEFECGNSEGSFLRNEISKELSTLLLTGNGTEGQSNGGSLEVIEESCAQFSEQANSNVMAYWDDFYKRTYYYDVESGESTWDPPPGVAHLVHGDLTDEQMIKLDEVQASCDVQPYDILDQEPKNEDVSSSSQQLDGIMRNELSVDNIYITTKRKKKTRRTKKNWKLSVSSEDLQGVVQEAVSASISKYWCQRYLLFSRFDYGIKMDEEGWFSVTPEPLAKHHALRCGYGAIVDFFTGVGGNAIQFAQRAKHVIAIDIDPNKIDYARHNASIYGVDDNIDFIKGNSFSLAPMLKANTVFMSPPWGGPDYSKLKKFDLNAMLKPRDGQTLFDAGKSIAPKIVMFLPRNVDINQLAELSLSAIPPWSLEVELNYLNGRLKAITAYFSETAV